MHEPARHSADQQELLPVLRLDSALGLDHGSENVLLRFSSGMSSNRISMQWRSYACPDALGLSAISATEPRKRLSDPACPPTIGPCTKLRTTAWSPAKGLVRARCVRAVMSVRVYPPFTRALLRELAKHDLVRDICGISGV